MNTGLATRAILFTDMVNSAEHRSRLGEEKADHLRRLHDELIGAAVAKHGGVVLRWTGDGVKASFPACSAALAAALAMLRSVRAYARRSDAVTGFEIRIGLSVGEVNAEDGDEHGVAIIEAARLEALAKPGEILATKLVQQMGERRVDAQFLDVGTQTLKGLDDPVEVVRVLDTVDADALPMPRALAIDRRFPIVGRTAVIDQIARRWSEATEGSVSTLLVTGQPGIGKSRVIADAAVQAHADGALVLAGICDGERPVPYQPFAMALADPALDDEQLASARTTGAGPLAALFPGSRAGRPDDQGPAARFELFDAVASLLQRLSTAQPVVLVLEDLHWATPPTLLLFRHVVQHLGDARLLVLGTYRDEEVGANSQLRDLLAEIRADRRAARVELTALDDGDVASMIASIVPDAPATHVAELARRLAEESAGNSFFVCELIDHLASTGELERLALQGAPAGNMPIPDTVRDVVGRRLGRLPDDSVELLMTAATVGLTFELDLIARVADLPLAEALRQVEEIERVALINEVDAGRYSFSHAIVRSTLLSRMSATRRALAHRTVAEAIESLGDGHHDELAHHWMLAGEQLKSIVHTELAARRDFHALAYESAAEKFQGVLDVAERFQVGLELEARACLGVALARRAIGHADFVSIAQRAGRLARKLKDAELMAEAALATIFPGGFFIAAGRTESGLIELCEDAVEWLDDADPRKVRIIATLAAHLTFDPDRQRRIDLLARALELARANGDPELVGAVLCAEFIALWDPTTATRRMEIAQQVSRMARASGDVELEFLGGFFSAFCAAERADVAEARQRLNQLGDVIDASRNFYFQFLVDRMNVSLNLLACKPDMQQQIDQLAAKYADRHADTAGTWALQTGILANQEGRLGELTEPLRAMVADSNLPASWNAAYGLALLANGEVEAAGAVLDSCSSPTLDYLWMSTQQATAELACGLGRSERCAQLFDELLPYRGQLGLASSGSSCYGLVSRTLGELALGSGRLDLAIELLTEAIAQAEAIGAPYEAATARKNLARALEASKN
ncbi:MAG: AAA family ATPase [Ilumatobacteraceae bacterium]